MFRVTPYKCEPHKEVLPKNLWYPTSGHNAPVHFFRLLDELFRHLLVKRI